MREETKCAIMGALGGLVVVLLLWIVGLLGKWVTIVLSTINAVAIVILVAVTWYYAHQTHELVEIEERREEGKKGKFMDVLLAEFDSNKEIFDYLKETLEKRSNLYECVFIRIKDDGWNIFRTQGGFRYLEEDEYDAIAKFYVKVYKINEEQSIRYKLYAEIRGLYKEEFEAFYDSLYKKDIPELEKELEKLKKMVLTRKGSLAT